MARVHGAATSAGAARRLRGPATAIRSSQLARVATSEWSILAGLLLLVFCAYLVRLRSVVVSDMDEGTYLYAARLVREGQTPYSDFFLGHPPLLIWMAAGWSWLAGPGVMAARAGYMLVILLGCVPLYLLGRRVTETRLGGLLAVTLYTSGILALSNMGRTVRLEPMMNAFVIAGLAAFVLGSGHRWRIVTGALFAFAVLVKLSAVLPIALFFVGWALWSKNGRSAGTWAPVAAGGVVVLLPAAIWLLSQPNFVDDVVRSQVDRPGLPLSTRLVFLRQDFVRFPPIIIGLAGAAWFAVKSPKAELRAFSLVALGATAVLVAGFKTFFGYYLVQVMPYYAMVAAAVALWAGRQVLQARLAPVLTAAVLFLGFIAPVAYAEFYYQRADDHVSSPATALALMPEGDGYIYSMYPHFALWSGREMYPWYYSADSLLGRITGKVGDQEFIETFSGSDVLILWRGELNDYPEAASYVHEHFTLLFGDAYYELWERTQ